MNTSQDSERVNGATPARPRRRLWRTRADRAADTAAALVRKERALIEAQRSRDQRDVERIEAKREKRRLQAEARGDQRTKKQGSQKRPIEDVLTVVAASIATGVSAQGMWRFSGDVLGLDGPLRLLLFAFIEVAIITSAVRARRNMRENFSAGIDGIAVWALTCLTAVLSSMDARSLPEAVFRLAAPLVAAWLWERGMAIERQRITGRTRINWRLTPERVLVRLGLAEANDRTASEVDAHRRITKVALAAKRARALRDAGAKPRKVARALATLDRALDRAVEHTQLSRDRVAQAALLDQLSTLYGAPRLLDLPGQAPWEHLDHPAVTGLIRDSEAVILAAALDRNTALRGETYPRPVATGDQMGDQLATATTTGRDSESGPLDVCAEVVPDARAGRSWLTTLAPWTRPVAIDPRDHNEDRLPVAETVAEAVANGASNGEAVATGPRPVADRKRPDEQDKRRAIRFYIGRAKKLNPPSKRVLAEWTGFSETWALGCIQDGQQQMTEQGWTFDDRGTPTPPPEVAEPVATTPLPTTANGDQS